MEKHPIYLEDIRDFFVITFIVIFSIIGLVWSIGFLIPGGDNNEPWIWEDSDTAIRIIDDNSFWKGIEVVDGKLRITNLESGYGPVIDNY